MRTAAPPLLDLLYVGETDSVSLSDERLGTSGIKSDALSLFRGQLRSDASPNVLKVCDWLKMVWVAARSLSAQVVKLKTFGNFPVLHLPCDPVRLSSSGTTVTSMVFGSIPNPAGGGESLVGDGVEMLSPEPPHFPTAVVIVDEADGFALDPSASGQRLGREQRELAASAFAEFRRLFSHVGLRSRLTLGGSGDYRSPHSIAWAV